MEDDNRISITVCGDGGCGKSSLSLRLVRQQWTTEYDPTIEDSYSVSRKFDGKEYLLSLTDTAGQEEYRGLWTTSNMKSDAFLLVYDITNAASLHALGHFIQLIDMETDERLANNAVPPVKIVAGNKCDLHTNRQVPAREGNQWASSRDCGFMETSAKTTVHVEETFQSLVRRVVEARRQQAQNDRLQTANTTQPLTPLDEKAGASGLASGQQVVGSKEQSPRKPGFFAKLRCW